MTYGRMIPLAAAFGLAAAVGLGVTGCGGGGSSTTIPIAEDAGYQDQSAEALDERPAFADRDVATDSLMPGRPDASSADAAGDLAMESRPTLPDGDVDAATIDVSSSIDADAPLPADASVAVEAEAEAGNSFIGDLTTRNILDAQGSDCVPCAQRSGCLDPAMMGGACEAVTGMAPSACQAVLGTASPVSESQVCLATLNAILSSGCAASAGGETLCLCGDQIEADNADDPDAGTPALCLAGGIDAVGPAAPYYHCDYGGAANTDMMVLNFTNSAFGAGQANAIAQCLVDLCGSGSCFP